MENTGTFYTYNYNSIQLLSFEKFIALAIKQNGKVPEDYQHGLLFAVTLDKNCVGVRLFSKNIQNFDERLDKYIDESLKKAIELKSLIEDGRCDIGSNREIVQNSSSTFTDSESLIRSRSKCEDNIYI